MWRFGQELERDLKDRFWKIMRSDRCRDGIELRDTAIDKSYRGAKK